MSSGLDFLPFLYSKNIDNNWKITFIFSFVISKACLWNYLHRKLSNYKSDHVELKQNFIMPKSNRKSNHTITLGWKGKTLKECWKRMKTDIELGKNFLSLFTYNEGTLDLIFAVREQQVISLCFPKMQHFINLPGSRLHSFILQPWGAFTKTHRLALALQEILI